MQTQCQCKFYNKCSAPICPFFSDIESAVWYPDEEICRNPDFKDAQWRKTQLKIGRKTNDTDTFYTFKMLNRNIIVTKAIKGLKPDSENWQEREKNWLKHHKHHEKKQLSQRVIDNLKKGQKHLKLQMIPQSNKENLSDLSKFDKNIK